MHCSTQVLVSLCCLPPTTEQDFLLRVSAPTPTHVLAHAQTNQQTPISLSGRLQVRKVPFPSLQYGFRASKPKLRTSLTKSIQLWLPARARHIPCRAAGHQPFAGSEEGQELNQLCTSTAVTRMSCHALSEAQAACQPVIR